MKIHMINGNHLTATNRRHMSSLIQKGIKPGHWGKSARIHYEFLSEDNGIQTWRLDRRGKYEITVTN